MIPHEKTSAFVSYSLCWTTSGAMYCDAPRQVIGQGGGASAPSAAWEEDSTPSSFWDSQLPDEDGVGNGRGAHQVGPRLAS